MNITLCLFGETKSRQTLSLIEEYEKRLTGTAHIQTHVLRPVLLPAEPSEAQIKAALREEAQLVQKFFAARARAYKIALCVEGKQLTSEEFADQMAFAMQQAGEILFLIGSSYGLDASVKAACHARISLSKMTLPHELARLFLTEQIYRAFTILSGKKYHK